MNIKMKLSGAVSGLAIVVAASAAQADVLFWSTQANPVEEQQAMRDQVLAGHGEAVDYQSNEFGPFITRIQAELEAGSGDIALIGALHGNFSAMNSFPMLKSCRRNSKRSQPRLIARSAGITNRRLLNNCWRRRSC